MFQLLCVFALLVTTHLCGKVDENRIVGRIEECHSIETIASEIEADTLVLFDIDKTALITSTQLGSPAWFDHLKIKILQWGLPSEAVVPLVCKVMQKTPHIAVEEATAPLISKLQEEGHLVFALTARLKEAPWDPHFDRTTHNHLKSAGIDFEKTQLPDHFCKRKHPPSFAYGIIFTSWRPKGPVLKHFLEEMAHRPSKVVFVDDQIDFLHSVEQSLAEMKIPFVGFHYRYCEKQFKSFDILVANLQLQHLEEKGEVLPEKAAFIAKRKLLRKNPSINPDFYLDKLLFALVKKQEAR